MCEDIQISFVYIYTEIFGLSETCTCHKKIHI